MSENALVLLSILMMISVLGIITIVIIYRKIQDDKLLSAVTNKNRGTGTERNLVLKMLKSNFDSRVVFHDLYIKRQYKGYAQIDMVVPTKVGILVFEVKNYGGWIFGNCNNYYWTQIMGYGKYKYRFYNPIKQNEGHIMALRSQLQDIGDVPYYSIIVFYGRCVLKAVSNVPGDVRVCYAGSVKTVINNLLAYNPPANYIDKRKVVNVLKDGVKNGADPLIQREHMQFIYERYY
ncbi:MAG: nuclease-related domain-containing protein [Rikenellaceae bacterium]